MVTDDDDYEIGYGRPPKQHQWKPGQSGYPKGRPKGARNLLTEVEELLKAQVTVTEGGRPKRVSVQKAALLRLVEKALKGDTRSIDRVLDLADRLSEERAGRQAERALSALEEDILERFLESRTRSPAKSQKDGRPDEDGHGE